jgi:Domain of unknown function (DUF5658)
LALNMSPLRVGTSRHFRWLGWIVGAVLMLNLLDAGLTVLWVHADLADEANPLIRLLVEEHPAVFVIAKMALVGLGTALLWMRRHRPAAVVGIFAVFLVYYALLLYHLGFIGHLLRD